MGRTGIGPTPAEVQSSSFGAVAAQHRKAALKAEREIERKRLERLEHAEAWVAGKPSLCVDGRPCPWAVWAALWLRAKFEAGGARVTVAAVQDFRRRQFRRLKERGLWDEAVMGRETR